jgi:hypothetical protein
MFQTSFCCDEQNTKENGMKNFTRFLAVIAVTLALAFPAAAPASSSAERHPEIREALASLRHAKEHLEHAAHDFGGHRVEAIRATDEAIHQLELCLEYDR